MNARICHICRSGPQLFLNLKYYTLSVVEVLDMSVSHAGLISSESYDVLYIIQGDMSFSLFKVRLVSTTEPQLHCGCIFELNPKQSRHSMCDAQERKRVTRWYANMVMVQIDNNVKRKLHNIMTLNNRDSSVAYICSE
jgi:hypothetical protein